MSIGNCTYGKTAEHLLHSSVFIAIFLHGSIFLKKEKSQFYHFVPMQNWFSGHQKPAALGKLLPGQRQKEALSCFAWRKLAPPGLSCLPSVVFRVSRRMFVHFEAAKGRRAIAAADVVVVVVAFAFSTFRRCM